MADETRWWWIRHAPVPWQTERRIYGHADIAADVSDLDRFRSVAARLPADAVVLRSFLGRTIQTLKALVEAGAPLDPDGEEETDLSEQNFGAWEGETWESLRAKGDTHVGPFWDSPYHNVPPGGESFVAMAHRVQAVIQRRTEAHRGRDIVAVAHSGSIRAALSLALDIAPERAFTFFTDNVAITRIDNIGGRWIVRCLNQV